MLGGLVAATLAACSVAPAPSTSPDCDATVTHVHNLLEGEDDTLSLFLVIDAHVAQSSDPATLESELARALHDLAVGDYDGDGRRDVEPLWQLRLVVLDARGQVMSATPSPAPERVAPGAQPLLEDAIEIWPGGEAPDAERWQTWFDDTARARIHEALTGESPTEPRLTAAVASLLERRPALTALPGERTLGVVLVSDRDEAAPLSILGRDEETFVTLLGAIPEPLLSLGAAGAFDALLAPQSFDETRVPCEDGNIAGAYPRQLLSALAVGASAGQWLRIGSLCEPHLLHEALQYVGQSSLVGRISGVCLPQPLPATDDGLVRCVMHALLPAYGVRTRCEQVGLVLDRVVPTDDGPRERCVVPQLLRRDVDSGRLGFYYDDFTSDLYDRCGEATPQALGLTYGPGTSPGTEIEADCFVGSPACGFELPDASVGVDAR